MALDARFQAELNEAIRKIRGVAPMIKKDVQADLTEASGILVSAVQARAPQSDKAHFRYNTAKVNKGIRAPKGKGTIKAVYMPGNLKKSFRTLKFRRSEAVFVGPKVGNTMPDGYYAHFSEFGTRNQPAQGYVKQAVSAAGRTTLDFAIKLIQRRIEKYAAQNAV